MTAARRVVITGLGPVSSIGVGRAEFALALREGRSGSAPIRSFDASGFPRFHAAEVQGVELSSLVRRIDTAKWGRSSVFAAAAARLAIEDAQLDVQRVRRARIGVVCGTTSGESSVIDALAAQVVAGGFESMQPELLAQTPAAKLGWAVSEELEIEGDSLTISTACAAGNFAIGYALDAIAAGDYDVVLAGGAESVCRWVHAGFHRLGTVATNACSPFDKDRAGILTAEGGAMLVLETQEHARARNAQIFAEVLGYASNCDADHMVAPNAASIARCIRAAHASASVTASDVDYICAHGTGTAANDVAEVRAIRDVFGQTVPPISSIKSMIGHTMGAAGAFGAIASVLAIKEGFLPPTINLRVIDPEMIDLELVPNRALERRPRVVQNDSFAFGGSNTILVLGAVA